MTSGGGSLTYRFRKLTNTSVEVVSNAAVGGGGGSRGGGPTARPSRPSGGVMALGADSKDSCGPIETPGGGGGAHGGGKPAENAAGGCPIKGGDGKPPSGGALEKMFGEQTVPDEAPSTGSAYPSQGGGAQLLANCCGGRGGGWSDVTDVDPTPTVPLLGAGVNGGGIEVPDHGSPGNCDGIPGNWGAEMLVDSGGEIARPTDPTFMPVPNCKRGTAGVAPSGGDQPKADGADSHPHAATQRTCAA